MTVAVKRIRSLSPISDVSPVKHAKKELSPSFELSLISWNVDNPGPYLRKGASSSSANTIRAYLQKTSNGRKGSSRANLADRNTSQPTCLYDIFRLHKFPTVCCLQEVKCAAGDREGIRALRQSAMPANVGRDRDSSSEEEAEATSVTKKQPSSPSYTAHFSLCQSTSGPKKFGVATYIRSDFPYQYSMREVDWDAEGRVLIMTIPKLMVCVVNVYALNGSDYTWKDPKTGQIKGTRNERKREFNRLLRTELEKLKNGGMELILVGDWNISLEARDCFPRLRTETPHAQARKEFNEVFIPKLGVVDVFRRIHGDKRSYSVSETGTSVWQFK